MNTDYALTKSYENEMELIVNEEDKKYGSI